VSGGRLAYGNWPASYYQIIQSRASTKGEKLCMVAGGKRRERSIVSKCGCSVQLCPNGAGGEYLSIASFCRRLHIQ